MTRYAHEQPTISAALHEPAARAAAVERRGQRTAALAAYCEVLGISWSDPGEEEVGGDELKRELDALCTQGSR
jgi:hypothetical protein